METIQTPVARKMVGVETLNGLGECRASENVNPNVIALLEYIYNEFTVFIDKKRKYITEKCNTLTSSI